MAANELGLVTTAIDATDFRDVAVIYAPEAFLTSDMDEDVVVLLENDMVDVMLDIDRKIYQKHVIYG